MESVGKYKIFDMRSFKPPVEVHGVAVLVVHGHDAGHKNAFSDTTIKTKVVQNVANDILVEWPGVRRPAELLQDAVQAGRQPRKKY